MPIAPLAVAAAGGGGIGGGRPKGGAHGAAERAYTVSQMQKSAADRRELEHELAEEIESEGAVGADVELKLLRQSGACLRQPWAHHPGDRASQRAYLHALLHLGVRRAERATMATGNAGPVLADSAMVAVARMAARQRG